MDRIRNRGAVIFGLMTRLAAIVALSLFVHVQMGGTIAVPDWISTASASTSTRTVYFPPLTGNDMVEFLDKNADHLRGTLVDYDGLYAFSQSVGKRPLIHAMRENIAAADKTPELTTEASPKVSITPEAP
ncbi:hypothetical protein HED60_06685 [Planctomycetales bacterium ZRK34]|nr:hypothetical protein HED60_06685 [Planctomycetales bacterium ZRK34]